MNSRFTWRRRALRRLAAPQRSMQRALWALCMAVGLWPTAAAAQWVQVPEARAEGLAQAVTALPVGPQPDPWAAAGNVAALAHERRFSASAGVVQHALLLELSRTAAAFALPLNSRQAVGLAVSSFGFGGYREALVGLAYAHRVHPRVSVGSRLGAMSMAVPGFGARWVPQVDAGVLVSLGKRQPLTVGLRTANAHGERVGAEQPQPLPRLYAIGVGWQVSQRVLIVVDHQHTEQVQTQHIGVEVRPTPAVAVRAGAVPALGRWHAGVGWHYRRLGVSAATRVDPVLGWSPSISLSYATSE